MHVPAPPDAPEVSVVISTFNRARQLEQTLPTVLCQDLGRDRYEVIVVNNNSTDGTAEVLRRFQARFPHLRTDDEAQPGASRGRNRGIAQSRAPIVAITDDDTEVASDWLSQILRGFAAHLDAAFIGGPVTPRWESTPPRWLTRTHWGPLAVLDYGEQPLLLGKERRLCLLTANFAVRKRALERVGLFAPEFLRCQDHELQFRMWQAGLTGIYVPAVVAWTTIPAERLRKSYHRQWFCRNGMYHALMPANALFDRPVETDVIVSLCGVPICVFRQMLQEAARAAWAYAQHREPIAFRHETQVWYLLGYAFTRLTRYTAGWSRQLGSRLWPFSLGKLSLKGRHTVLGRSSPISTRTSEIP